MRKLLGASIALIACVLWTAPPQVPAWALMLLAAGALIVFAPVVGLNRERRISAAARFVG